MQQRKCTGEKRKAYLRLQDGHDVYSHALPRFRCSHEEHPFTPWDTQRHLGVKVRFTQAMARGVCTCRNKHMGKIRQSNSKSLGKLDEGL
jgi:hypothetical protein